jgi:hypothetical protein
MGFKWVLFVVATVGLWYALRIDHIFGQWGLVIIIVVVGLTWYNRAASSLLQRWAQRNDFRIISQERRDFRTGPFFLRTSKGQQVFPVTVSDPVGYTRSGWVRVGDWWVGLTSDKVEVRWDDEKS